MKLKEFIKNLHELVAQNQEALEFEVVYSRDDEGNGYQEVWCKPELAQFDAEDQEFVAESHYKEEPEYYEEYKPNSVCIN